MMLDGLYRIEKIEIERIERILVSIAIQEYFECREKQRKKKWLQ